MTAALGEEGEAQGSAGKGPWAATGSGHRERPFIRCVLSLDFHGGYMLTLEEARWETHDDHLVFSNSSLSLKSPKNKSTGFGDGPEIRCRLFSSSGVEG